MKTIMKMMRIHSLKILKTINYYRRNKYNLPCDIRLTEIQRGWARIDILQQLVAACDGLEHERSQVFFHST